MATILTVIIIIFLLFSGVSAFFVLSFCVMSSRFHQRQLTDVDSTSASKVKSNTQPLSKSSIS